VNASLTYVFCLVRSARRPSVGRVASTLPGVGELRVLEAGPLTWLIVASVPEREYSETALAKGLQDLDWVGRRAMAHESTIEHFLSASAVLPMQLFTLFTSDERAVAHVTKDRRKIERILKRIDRQHEWGLRLTWDEKAAHEKALKGTAPRRAASGADYLARRRDLLDVDRVQLTRAKSEAARVYRAVSRQATNAVRRTSLERAAPGSRLLLDAAFLVPVTRAASFRAAVRQQARVLGTSGVVVSLTGPWPPYNFI
jgi:hypothetical protein